MLLCLANVVPTFSVQGKLKKSIAETLGLKEGTPIAYRAGDQPNNAFSLNVLNPGETAATAGTSGVIYSVTDKNAYDTKSRVNTFIHVNNRAAVGATRNNPQLRNGVLLCINGTGILNSWLRKNMRVLARLMNMIPSTKFQQRPQSALMVLSFCPLEMVRSASSKIKTLTVPSMV